MGELWFGLALLALAGLLGLLQWVDDRPDE
jgi:hypothetical protein